MPATTADAFLEDILGNPEDDAVRLIYADWLEEHADKVPRGAKSARDRAMFIRLQIELEHLSDDDEGRLQLEAKAERLRQRHEEWLRPLTEANVGRQFVFRRGFPEMAFVDTKAFLQGAERLFRLAPIRTVQFESANWHFRSEDDEHSSESHVARLAASPHLAKLTGLVLRSSWSGSRFGNVHITNQFSQEELQALFHSPHLRAPTFLQLTSCIGDRGVKLLAQAPAFANLRTLELESCGLGEIGLAALANSPHLCRLTRLSLPQNQLKNIEGIGALARSPLLAGLTHLSLSHNDLDEDSLITLMRSPNLERLTSLELAHTCRGDEAMMAVVASPWLANLTTLNLECFGAGATAALALARSPSLKQLRRLNLCANLMPASAIAELVRSLVVVPLHTLDLGCSHVMGDEGVKTLVTAPELANLSTLRLKGSKLSDAAAFALANAPHLNRLRSLDLESNHIGEEGILALAERAVAFPELTINLSDNPVRRQLFDALHKRFGDRLTLTPLVQSSPVS